MFDEKKMKSVPGPGTYAMHTIHDGPSYGMGLKLKDLGEMTKGPGPGNYNQSKDSIVHKAPIFSMGGKLKGELDKKNFVPGPGQYVDNREKLRNSSPSYGFGSMQRPDIAGKASNFPGPGTYAIKSKVGEATASISK